MTNRAFSLIVPAVVGLVLGILRNQQALALLSLSLLIWIFAAWLNFLVQNQLRWPVVKFSRRINGRADREPVLWAERSLTVDVTIAATGRTIRPLTVFRDVLPDMLQLNSGSAFAFIQQRVDEVQLSYECHIRSAGRLTFPGLLVRLQDPCGLFVADHFIRQPQAFRVFPAYVRVGDIRPGVKRMNSLPQHGVHRLQRAGFGSELLELREYQPGDPPKAIAWKVSARRDRLMTRQYESEVPVRVTMFVDGHSATRLGRFGDRLLDQILFSTASIARASISVGDPIAAVLLDERGTRRLPPGSGDRAFYRLLEALSEFAESPQEPLPHSAWPRAVSTATAGHPGIHDEVSLPWSADLLQVAMAVCQERYPDLLDGRVNQPPFTWFPLGPKTRRLRHARTQLAAVLAELTGLSPAELIGLIYDDRRMAALTERLLADAGMSQIPPLFDAEAVHAQDAAARWQILTQELATSVARAHDNEVFVILTELAECADQLHLLLPAIKVALARHHRVIVISPTLTGQRPNGPLPYRPIRTADDVFKQAEHVRIAEQAAQVRRQLRRIGASVAFSGPPEATALVLAEAELAGRGRSVAGRTR